MNFNIFEEFSEDELKLLNYNFAFLELLQKETEYKLTRGARQSRSWHYIEDNGSQTEVIREFYEYEWKQEFDGKQRYITKVTKKVRFYDGEGNIGLERVIKVRSDAFYLEGLNRDIRQNRVDYMKAWAKIIESQLPYMPTSPTNIQAHYTAVLSAINNIIQHYSVIRLEYIEDGSMKLELALVNEVDVALNADLALTTIFPGQDPAWPTGQTIKQGILHQLNGDK